MILMKMKLGLTVLAIMAAPTAFGQGVPTIDVTSIAKLQEMIAEQKLQLREQIAQNVKLDEQTLKLVEQIRTLEAQLDALRNGLSLADLGLDPASFLRDILPDFSDLSQSLDAAKAGKLVVHVHDRGGCMAGLNRGRGRAGRSASRGRHR